MKTFFYSALMIIAIMSASQALASDAATIYLNDGSVLSGEIMSLNNGTYSIQTKSMGILNISKSNISSINFKPGSGISSSNPEETGVPGNIDVTEKTEELSKTIMADKGLLNKITGLQNNPDFKAVINDPAIMNAIKAGNINELISNPKLLKLMENSDVKAITNKLAD